MSRDRVASLQNDNLDFEYTKSTATIAHRLKKGVLTASWREHKIFR